MHTVVFASGGGANLQTALDYAGDRPDLVSVNAVVTDRTGIRAIDIAKEHCIPVITREFSQIDKTSNYRHASEKLHDEILGELLSLPCAIDLVVLSYRRIIRGKLLKRFEGRMINQHPGDLSLRSEDGTRVLTGCDPVYKALTSGIHATRTCCFLVREGMDTGEILCSGPLVAYTGPTPITKDSAWEHEQKQKAESDRPCLRFTLEAIATGRMSVKPGSVCLDGIALPYGGKDLHTSPSL